MAESYKADEDAKQEVRTMPQRPKTRRIVLRCPLLFTFNDRVSGNRFLADVVAHGRALAVMEGEGEVWMCGVNPGGLAAVGKDENLAYQEFRKEYTLVLHEIAEDAQTFGAFKQEVERFFNETNQPTEQDWLAAVQEVRAGRITGQCMPQLVRTRKRGRD